MKINKKKVNKLSIILLIAIVILGLITSIFIYFAKQPKVLGTAVNADYTFETFYFGPYKTALYYPSGTNVSPAPYPVIVFHHGMMAQYDYYVWFAEAMAKKGYVVVLPNRIQPGVDLDAGSKLTNYLLTYLSYRNKFTSNLRGKIDLNRVGVAGHSMGADLTLYGANLAKVKALLAIAPASKETGAMKLVYGLTEDMPLGKYIERTMNKLYNTISTTQKPVMYLVGSLDGICFPKASETLYGMTKSKKMLAIIKGANHVQFSPAGVVGDKVSAELDKTPTVSREEVLKLTITYGGAWFDYILKGDQKAKSILDQGNSLSPGAFSTYTLAY